MKKRYPSSVPTGLFFFKEFSTGYTLIAGSTPWFKGNYRCRRWGLTLLSISKSLALLTHFTLVKNVSSVLVPSIDSMLETQKQSKSKKGCLIFLDIYPSLHTLWRLLSPIPLTKHSSDIIDEIVLAVIKDENIVTRQTFRSSVIRTMLFINSRNNTKYSLRRALSWDDLRWSYNTLSESRANIS